MVGPTGSPAAVRLTSGGGSLVAVAMFTSHVDGQDQLGQAADGDDVLERLLLLDPRGHDDRQGDLVDGHRRGRAQHRLGPGDDDTGAVDDLGRGGVDPEALGRSGQHVHQGGSHGGAGPGHVSCWTTMTVWSTAAATVVKPETMLARTWILRVSPAAQ